MQKFVFAWKPTKVSLAEQLLSLSSLVVTLCRKVHQEQLEESGMAPSAGRRFWTILLLLKKKVGLAKRKE